MKQLLKALTALQVPSPGSFDPVFFLQFYGSDYCRRNRCCGKLLKVCYCGKILKACYCARILKACYCVSRRKAYSSCLPNGPKIFYPEFLCLQ